MAEYTSSQAGDWSVQATWGGSGPPGNTDTAIIAHAVNVDAPTTVGASGAAASVAVTVQSGKTLTVAIGIVFKVRGDLVLQNANLTMEAGSSYIFDSSLAAGTPIYKIVLGSSTAQSNNIITINGLTGSHCTMGKAASSGVGVITQPGLSQNYFGGVTATYTDFTDMGNSTPGLNTDAMYFSPGTGSQKASFENCTFTRCSRMYITPQTTQNLVFTDNVVTANVGDYSLWIWGTSTGSGTRVIQDNVSYSETNKDYAAVVFANSVRNTSFDRNIVTKIQYSVVTDVANAMTSCSENLIYQRTGNGKSHLGEIGGTATRNYFLRDNLHVEGGYLTPFAVAGSGASGTITLDGVVVELTSGQTGSDWFQIAPAESTTTYVLKNALTLPNASGEQPGNITGHGSKYSKIEIDHCTLIASGDDSTSMGSVLIGSGFPGNANMINALKNTLFWSKVLEDSDHFGTAATQYIAYWPITGTADSGAADGTTLVDSNPSSAFSTDADKTLGDAGAVCVITGRGGTGPSVGEWKVIASNTSTTLTFATGFSAQIDTGTTYKICPPNTLNTAGVLNNAMYNVNAGATFNATGGNSTASYYDNFWLADQTVGSTDFELGTGSDESASGPRFADSTRNFATAYTECFAESAGAAWDSGTEYHLGDFVSNSDAAFYGGATITYRGIATGTNKEPGVAADWRTYWEFATVSVLKADTTKIGDLYDWVRGGFAVSNITLQDAGTDGDTIGACGYLATLVIQDSVHAHRSSNLLLSPGSGASDLTIADSVHAHTSDLLTLTTAAKVVQTLTIPDSVHAHTSDNLTLTSQGIVDLAAATGGTARYDVGDLVRVIGSWHDPFNGDVAIDPTVVKCSIKTPASVTTTYTYGTDADVKKESTGVYYMDVSITQSGNWYYRWWSTGTAQAAEENVLVVAPQSVATPVVP